MANITDRNDPYGWDVFIGPAGGGVVDMLPNGAACSGAVLVQNALIHRLMQDTLPLIGAPGGYVAYGVNVRRWVGEVTTQDRANAKGPDLAIVIARETRIDQGSIAVSLTIAPSGSRTVGGALVDLIITISARTTTALPIVLVLGVNSVTVDLLAQGS